MAQPYFDDQDSAPVIDTTQDNAKPRFSDAKYDASVASGKPAPTDMSQGGADDMMSMPAPKVDVRTDQSQGTAMPAVQTVKDLATGYGPAEAAVNVATSFLLGFPGGLGGAVEGMGEGAIRNLLGEDVDPLKMGKERFDLISNAFTYEPKSDAAKRLAETVQLPLRAIASAAGEGGVGGAVATGAQNIGLGPTASAVLGAAADASTQMAAMALGFKAVEGVMPPRSGPAPEITPSPATERAFGEKLKSTLLDPEAPADQRAAAASAVASRIHDVDPAAAQNFHDNATADINAGRPVDLSPNSTKADRSGDAIEGQYSDVTPAPEGTPRLPAPEEAAPAAGGQPPTEPPAPPSAPTAETPPVQAEPVQDPELQFHQTLADATAGRDVARAGEQGASQIALDPTDPMASITAIAAAPIRSPAPQAPSSINPEAHAQAAGDLAGMILHADHLTKQAAITPPEQRQGVLDQANSVRQEAAQHIANYGAANGVEAAQHMHTTAATAARELRGTFEPPKPVQETPVSTERGQVNRADQIKKINGIKDQMKALVEGTGGNLTAAEGARFDKLSRDLASARHGIGKPETAEQVAATTPAERMSSLTPGTHAAIAQDVWRHHDIFTALASHTAGTGFSTDTAIDRIFDGKDKDVTPKEMYDNFKGTRDALRKQYGDSVELFRAPGLQKSKTTENWATTREFAKQFGDKVISRKVPIEDILAANVGGKGRYHELIVGDHNAIREQSAGEVLQREPGEAGVAGGERGRVEPSVQGREVAAAGEAEAQGNSERGAVEHLPAQTEAQKTKPATAANVLGDNAALDHERVGEHNVSWENRRGTTRFDLKEGKWQTKMKADYGRIKSTRGADGEAVDIFHGRKGDKTFIVDQLGKSGKFDEHKVMYGYQDIEAAKAGYLAHYPEGWKGLGAIHEVSADGLKSWLSDGDLKKPYAESIETQHDSAHLKNSAALNTGGHLATPTRPAPDVISKLSRAVHKSIAKAGGIPIPPELHNALGGIIDAAHRAGVDPTLLDGIDTFFLTDNIPRAQDATMTHAALGDGTRHLGINGDLLRSIVDGDKTAMEAAALIYTHEMAGHEIDSKRPFDRASMTPSWDWVQKALADAYADGSMPAKMKAELAYPLHPSYEGVMNEDNRRSETFAQTAMVHTFAPKILKDAFPDVFKLFEDIKNETSGQDPVAKRDAVQRVLDQHAAQRAGGVPEEVRPGATDGGEGGPVPSGQLASHRTRVPEERAAGSGVEGRSEHGPSVSTAVSIREAPETAGLSKRPSINDVALHFNELVAKEHGGPLDYANPEHVAIATKQAIAEFKYQLKQAQSGLDWYTGNIAKSWEASARVFPEFADPAQAAKRQLASIAIGLMSPANKAPNNWYDGMANWAYRKEHGEFSPINPESGQYWTIRPSTSQALTHLNNLIDDLGEDGAVDWLLTMHPVKELNATKHKYGTYKNAPVSGKMDEQKMGVEIYGPKVGPFTLDVLGIDSEGTVDAWRTRTLRRWFGTAKLLTDKMKGAILDDSPTEQERVLAQKIDAEVGRATGYKNKQAQSVLWFFEQQLYMALGVRGIDSHTFLDGAESYANDHAGPAEGNEQRGGATVPAESGGKETAADLQGHSRGPVKPSDFEQDPADALKRPGWAILNANVGDPTSPESAASNRRLEKELTRRGIEHQEVTGNYKGKPDGTSFIAYTNEKTASDLGKKFSQESVLTNNGLVYSDGRPNTPADHSKTVVGPAARKQDFYTTLPNGTDVSMGLNFGGEQPEQKPLEGLPESSPGPHAPARAAAEQYMKEAGLPYNPPTIFSRVVPQYGARIADAYEAMEHNPSDPKVKAAYDALIRETVAQWHAMMATGLKVEFTDADHPYPYDKPSDAVHDVRDNNHLWVYSTDMGFGSDHTFDASDNPLLAKTGIKVDGKDLLANDVFRAVHDYFGHVKEGLPFRANGEENAWRSHAAMYTPEARKAMTSETRGQNSWLNWGPHGEANRTAKTEDTIFADQKTGLLPDEFTEDNFETPDMQGHEPAPLWKSALVEAVPKAPWSKAGDMPAAQFAAWLKSNAPKLGIKSDEMVWSGLDDYLKLVASAPRTEQVEIKRLAHEVYDDDPRSLTKIQKSVAADGIKEPLELWEYDGKLNVQDGKHRLEVARRLGLTHVPADITSSKPRQDGKVSRDQVQQFLDQNGVKVEEKMLGEPTHDVEAWWNDEGGANEAKPFSELDGDERHEALLRYVDEVGQYEDDVAKYGDRVLPGGKNYRELLLTLPGVGGRRESLNKQIVAVMDRMAGASGEKYTALWNERQALYKQWEAAEGKSFQSSHFDQPNILAHVRFNERTDADGKKVLFIEEIQSDWAQKGRKQGFNDGADRYHVKDNSGDQRTVATFDNAIAAQDYIREHPGQGLSAWQLPDKSGPPAAPFVGKTEAWVALALKRMIRYAADNGFDRVAWTNGEQQAARYDLSKQVSEVNTLLRSNGKYKLEVDDMAGNPIFTGDLTEKELEDHVGKDLAKKIVEDGVDRIGHTYSGLDLKVGGEGMKSFYDKIVPNVANDVLKKLGGGRVDGVEMASKGPYSAIKSDAEGRGELMKGNETLDHFDTLKEAQEAADEMNADWVAHPDPFERGEPTEEIGTQPGFDITPEMKELAGEPMFQFHRPHMDLQAHGGYDLYGDLEQPERKRGSALDAVQKLLAPASRGPIAERQAGIMRENLARQARSSILAANKFRGYAALFNKMPVREQVAFINAYEHGEAQASPELAQAAEAIRAFNRSKVDAVQALGTGKLEEFDTNYLGRIWKRPQQAQAFFGKRPLEGAKGFLKKRTFQYFIDGINAGFEPVTFNPIEMMLLKGAEVDRYVYGQKIIGEMHSAGFTRLVPFGERPPEGWTKINDKIAQAGSAGHYFAPDEAATLINNHLSPSLQGNAVYDLVRQSGMLLNSAQLGLSAFHLGFTTLDSMVSKIALANQQLSRGVMQGNAQQLGAGLGGYLQGVNPLQPFVNLMKGDRLFKAYMGNVSNPQMAAVVDALLAGGGRVRLDDFYRNSTVNAFRQAVKRRDIKGVAMKALPTLLDKINAPIFEYLVPRQKLGVFFDMASDWLKRNPGASEAATRAAMGKFWDSVDNRLGQLVYDNVFWNRALKDALMISVRSVGWNLGTFRELGGGAADVRKVAADKEFSPRLGYLLALPFLAALYGSILGYLYTGKGPETIKDMFFPKTGRKRPDGSDDRVSLPSYMKDIYAYGHDIKNFVKYGANPFSTLENKMHPLFGVIAQMLTNKDFFGAAIRSPGDPMVKQLEDEAKYVIAQLTPFGVRNYAQQQKTKGQDASVAGYLTSPSMVGITPAPGYITKTDQQTEAAMASQMKDSLISKFRQELKDGADRGETVRRMNAAGLRPNEITMVLHQGNNNPYHPSSNPRHFGN